MLCPLLYQTAASAAGLLPCCLAACLQLSERAQRQEAQVQALQAQVEALTQQAGGWNCCAAAQGAVGAAGSRALSVCRSSRRLLACCCCACMLTCHVPRPAHAPCPSLPPGHRGLRTRCLEGFCITKLCAPGSLASPPRCRRMAPCLSGLPPWQPTSPRSTAQPSWSWHARMHRSANCERSEGEGARNQPGMCCL